MMTHSFHDVAPVPPLLSSRNLADDALVEVEYFEVEPATMAPRSFDRHCLLIHLGKDVVRVDLHREGRAENLTLGRNSVVATPAGIRTAWRWHDPAKVALVWISPEAARRFIEVEVGVFAEGSALDSLLHFADAELTDTARDMTDVLRDPGVGSDVMFDALARVFLVTATRKYARFDAEQPAGLDNRRYGKLVGFIKANLSRKISVEMMARELGMSASHFAHTFKDATHRSPMDFVMSIRVEEAADRLRRETTPISEIAVQCGFSDQSHLTRVFRKWKDQTPAQFRKSNS